MPMTDKQKECRDRWDAENMSYQTVKLRKETLTRFKEICRARGEKVNTVLREAIERYIAEYGDN